MGFGLTGLTVVFAPSCARCAKKLPALMAKRAELVEARASIVLVAVPAGDESDTQALDALRSWGVTQRFLVDRGVALRRSSVRDARVSHKVR